MLTNLYFVRHAHSIYTPNELERPLSEQGFEDAKKVSHVLEKENIDHVISSPYKRAVQTVNKLAEQMDKEVIIKNDFKERRLSKDPVENFQSAIIRVWEEPGFSWDGGESNKVARIRGARATLALLEKYKGKNVAVGTHGNIMVLIMNYFDSKYDFNFWRNLDMPDIYKLTFEEGKLKEVNRIWNGL